MKYLVVTTPHGNLPPDAAEGLFKAGKAWLDAAVADRTIDFVHGFAGGGGVSVANADSHDALMAQIRGFPLFPFVGWDIRPLVDIHRSFDSAIEMFQKMAG